MVHPDHRRRGLFTRMTESALEKYSDAEPSFLFNFPNQRAKGGYLKLGWEKVAAQSTYYRIHDPAATVQQQSASPWTSLVTLVSKPLLSGYNRLSNVRSDPTDELTVREYESVPSTVLAAMAEEQSRGGIQVFRDEQFYEWRFGNPAWRYRTYVAEEADEPVAAMVVGTSAGSVSTTTKVIDVVPLPREASGDGLEALLYRLVREYADSDLLVAPSILPRSTARRAGFHRDDRPPLSYVANRTTHVVRSLTGEWDLNGLDITDEENWRLTFSELDTS